ncbi:hypothetical protein [Staphylococcus epidermidis]|uniref:hypothetical protein n=1 Tax=Staphylococcus epidermidis TaxID=1282 RepID=UPI0034D5B327
MKKVLFLIFSSLLVLGACGNNDSEKKEDNKSSEHKKSNDPKKDKKLENKDKSNKNTNDDKQEASSDDSNNDTANNESESTSKSDNGKTQSANGNNERTQGKQATQQNNNQQQSSNQQSQNNNGYMTQEQINEWNKNKPTTHDESQMGYGRGDYEQARKDSEKVWNDPNAHVGGPRWVGKNEGYESWAKRQQEVQNSIAE